MIKKKKRREGPKWYCDACVLEKDIIFKEITNNTPKKPIISHLALGEAYGNCLKKGIRKANSFIEFINLLKKEKYLNTIGNDNIEKVFNEIMNNDEIRMSITDAMHLATAIKNKCCIFKTTDKNDFKGTNKKKIKEIAKKYDIDDFSISVKEF
jgi:predicted nucleic acid-binding protein